MHSKHFVPLVVTMLSAAVLAPSAVSEAIAIPFFGDSLCKSEKTRLKHEEQLLHDRQQLALHQCHAALDRDHERCQSLKRRQKEEMKLFKARGKNQIHACKQATKDPKTAEKAPPKPPKPAKPAKADKGEKAGKKASQKN
jgi:hypothetical protein